MKLNRERRRRKHKDCSLVDHNISIGSHMGSSSFSLTSLVVLLLLASPTEAQPQSIRSARLLDLLIRDYTVNSFDSHFKTGIIQRIDLPSNFSGIRVDTGRFRCGSLSRYGARIGEFNLGVGLRVQPCAERVMLVKQSLGTNWSSLYYSNYNLSGYELVSPVLGLLAYNADHGGGDNDSKNPFEIKIVAGQSRMTVNFSNLVRLEDSLEIKPRCACFESNGKMTLKGEVSPFVCSATKQGHFGLVIKKKVSSSSLRPSSSVQQEQTGGKVKSRISKWKIAVGSVIGSAIGAFLLGLLLVAMFVKVKKKAMRQELERRAYEEEALQVSMVGHVRAPTASGTRTTPRIEHAYRSYPS